MDKGIHLINNVNPSNPINTGFLAIPGNRDMAMYQGVLYADNYMDLLAFDLSNPAAPELVTRQKNVFNMFKESNQGVLIDYRNGTHPLRYPACLMTISFSFVETVHLLHHPGIPLPHRHPASAGRLPG
ncbi:MAG: hypothetical protein IPJ06_11830 [Saprospiraceae bacterium]|nr:hypothetical protein [Saprospiraceae bacterium]